MPMFVLLLYIGERCDGNNAGRGEITRSGTICGDEGGGALKKGEILLWAKFQPSVQVYVGLCARNTLKHKNKPSLKVYPPTRVEKNVYIICFVRRVADTC